MCGRYLPSNGETGVHIDKLVESDLGARMEHPVSDGRSRRDRRKRDDGGVAAVGVGAGTVVVSEKDVARLGGRHLVGQVGGRRGLAERPIDELDFLGAVDFLQRA